MTASDLDRLRIRLTGAWLSLISARILASISSLALAVFVIPVSEFVVDSFVSCVL